MKINWSLIWSLEADKVFENEFLYLSYKITFSFANGCLQANVNAAELATMLRKELHWVYTKHRLLDITVEI